MLDKIIRAIRAALREGASYDEIMSCFSEDTGLPFLSNGMVTIDKIILKETKDNNVRYEVSVSRYLHNIVIRENYYEDEEETPTLSKILVNLSDKNRHEEIVNELYDIIHKLKG